MSHASHAKPMEYDEFHEVYGALLGTWLENAEHFAVAVSGGPDSMALCHLLYHWAQQNNKTCHALTVNHGLRQESHVEAQTVQNDLKLYDYLKHTILTWKHNNPETRIQESARDARYDLMAQYCKSHKIKHLFLAHHADDQAETVLFRLAKGSGLDGLSGMKLQSAYNDDLSLCRPFLNTEKSRLMTTCDHHKISYVSDPSNENTQYARARLRKAHAVLQAEGLTTKRLNTTAKRISRAVSALYEIADTAYQNCADVTANTITFDMQKLLGHPHEITLRVIMRAMNEIAPGMVTRMERIETLCDAVIAIPQQQNFRKRTLGGIVFEWNENKNTLVLTKEHAG